MHQALQPISENQTMKTGKSPGNAQAFRLAAVFSMAPMIFALLSLQPRIAMAEVFKCMAGGATVYQGLPCDGKMVENSSTATNQAAPVIKPAENAIARPATVRPAAARPNVDTGARTTAVSQAVNFGKLSLAQLYAAIVAASNEMRGLSAEHDKNVKALSPADTAGLELAHNTYHSRVETNDRLRKALTSELRRRCPGGANMSANSQQCKQ